MNQPPIFYSVELQQCLTSYSSKHVELQQCLKKGAVLFRSSLNIHNQFSQVSWLALVWPRILYVYMQSNSAHTNNLKTGSKSISGRVKNLIWGGMPPDPLESASLHALSRGDRISVCSSGLSTFYLLPTGL